MVYNTQNYFVFRLCPSSGILETRTHNNTKNRPIWRGSSLSAMRLPTHREDLYDMTDPSWVSIRFQSRVFRFQSTDGATGRNYVSSQIFHFLLRISPHALGFVGWVCSINFYLPFYPSSTNLRALSQFLLHIFLLSPSELAWSQVMK
jgi:hypothetical protein